MSVTIHDYLFANNNKLTALLGDKDMAGVFLEDTLIEVRQRDKEWWCDIFLEYTLSCNDLTQLLTTFAGYWWCVCHNFGEHSYKLSVNLKDDLE